MKDRRDRVSPLVKEVVDKYSRDQLAEANKSIESINHGGGCSCPNCCKQAARDFNWWSDFRYGVAKLFQAFLVTKGRGCDVEIQPTENLRPSPTKRVKQRGRV